MWTFFPLVLDSLYFFHCSIQCCILGSLQDVRMFLFHCRFDFLVVLVSDGRTTFWSPARVRTNRYQPVSPGEVRRVGVGCCENVKLSVANSWFFFVLWVTNRGVVKASRVMEGFNWETWSKIFQMRIEKTLLEACFPLPFFFPVCVCTSEKQDRVDYSSISTCMWLSVIYRWVS